MLFFYADLSRHNLEINKTSEKSWTIWKQIFEIQYASMELIQNDKTSVIMQPL